MPSFRLCISSRPGAPKILLSFSTLPLNVARPTSPSSRNISRNLLKLAQSLSSLHPAVHSQSAVLPLSLTMARTKNISRPSICKPIAPVRLVCHSGATKTSPHATKSPKLMPRSRTWVKKPKRFRPGKSCSHSVRPDASSSPRALLLPSSKSAWLLS